MFTERGISLQSALSVGLSVLYLIVSNLVQPLTSQKTEFVCTDKDGQVFFGASEYNLFLDGMNILGNNCKPFHAVLACY